MRVDKTPFLQLGQGVLAFFASRLARTNLCMSSSLNQGPFSSAQHSTALLIKRALKGTLT